MLADSQFRLHPLTDVDAREMIEGLRGVVLLRGHRGGHALDMAALEDALLRLSALVDICPEIRELDINPLTVLAEGVRALDARVRIEPPADAPASRRITY